MKKQKSYTPYIVAAIMFSYIAALIILFVKCKYGIIKDGFMPATLMLITLPLFSYKWKLKQINSHPMNADRKARLQDEHDNVELFSSVGFMAGTLGLVATILDLSK